MYSKEALEKLEYLMASYEAKLYRGEDVERAYLSLCGFDDLHKSITGENIFDERLFQVLRPSFYNSAIKYNDFLHDIIIYNFLSLEKFTLEEFPKIIEYLDYNLDRCNVKEKFYRDISEEDSKDFINDFLKHSIYVKDIDTFNRMLMEGRILNGNVVDDYKGITYFDFCGNNDYILLDNNYFNNYKKCCSVAHELGHIEDAMYLNSFDKTVYISTSAFVEASGHMLQNSMYDFMLNNNIEPDMSKYFKYSFLRTLSYRMKNAYLSFEHKDDVSSFKINPFHEILYAYGKMMGVYLTNCNIEELGKFNRLHYRCKDASLLTGMNIKQDGIIKVLSKEFEKINR